MEAQVVVEKKNKLLVESSKTQVDKGGRMANFRTLGMRNHIISEREIPEVKPLNAENNI